MDSTADDGVFESRIGTGTKITGKLTFRGRTKIEGDAEGEIRGEEIVIAQSAVVSAKVWATTLIIAGRVTGELVASERIELLATARAKCTINTPRLVLMEGAQFEGDCKMPQQGAPAHTGEPRLAAAGASGDARA
ncbi:MAG: polymer-forming cytoskeletal protein [Candidatus Binatales bacterium]